VLTKTNYIIWRDCKKNAWLKVHKPDIYFANELSDFEKQIIETGNEVDLLARELLPTGEFQKKFEINGYMAITDILHPSTNSGQVASNIYEVKATNEVDKKTHLHDLTFQYNVLKMCGVEVESANLIHLNPEYVRQGEIELDKLFMVEDLTEKVKEISEEVKTEMQLALDYITEEKEPNGPCDCIYKGRSAHCTTFNYSNPNIPKYGIHDLARIGLSKRKLTELVDGHKFLLEDVPPELELSDAQKNQVWTYLTGETILSREAISEELDKLTYPLYFLDYETFPAAIPRFDGFSPYNQIPFQYSLHVLKEPKTQEPEHKNFLWTENSDPSRAFAESMRSHIGSVGNIVVWHKELAQRLPEFSAFFEDINARIFDLEIIFKKQHYVHKDFKGSSSIKKVLPVLVPSLKYDELTIREGGSAAEGWNRVATGKASNQEIKEITQALHEYCKLDTYAMYSIWRELYKLVN
jgi:hypothetical protein